MEREWKKSTLQRPPKVFNIDLLIEVGKDRGYTKKQLWQYLKEYIGYNKRSQQWRIKVCKGQFTYSDIVLIADALALTPAEFIEIFFSDLFEERKGKVIAHLDDEQKSMYYERRWHMNQVYAARREARLKAEKEAEKQEALATLERY